MFGFGKKKNSSDSSEKKDRQISVPSPGIKGSLVSLEQRLMFDAAASATVSEVASEQVAQEQAEAAVSSDAHTEGQSAEQAESQGLLDAIATYNPGESRSEVVFVDPTVPNYQDLLSGMNSNVEVIMLDGGQDGIEQMANALSGRSGIDAIHVISHGGAGELQLGTGVLNADSMSTQYADDMAVIQQALSEQADILVYGCEFAQGEVGQAAVDMLAELTGADVQASTDLTGSISLGGDWEFEVSTGTIETSLAIDYDAQMNWAGILGTETVADTFSDKSYGNNDGTQSWSSKWSEVDVGASDANGGHIKVNSGELRIETQKVGASVSRGVNLSGVGSATLSFDYENDFDKGGSVDIRISTDGGKSYTTLDGGTFSRADNTGSGTAKFDISDYASANTKIQFIVTGTSGGDRLFVDNVQISYDTEAVNQAPTDLSLSANSVAENARTGTVVGTVTGTDPDARDTKTYSLTDTAGGRFAINASTGVITVADGSLLNYEHAASHNLTVQVTDSGGASYRERFTITLTNVNEGPAQVEKGDGGEQTLVASLFQKSPAWSEAVMPRASSPSIESDGDRSELWLPNELRKPVEWDLPAAPTVDILAPGRNLSDHALEGVEKQVGGSERKGHSSTASSQQEGTMVDRDSSDSARPESSQVAWQPTEETHNAPDNARDLAMPMMAGLVGAALQGTVRRKEKLATLHGELPTSDQEAATEQTAQEPNPDDQQAPPKAA